MGPLWVPFESRPFLLDDLLGRSFQAEDRLKHSKTGEVSKFASFGVFGWLNGLNVSPLLMTRVRMSSFDIRNGD